MLIRADWGLVRLIALGRLLLPWLQISFIGKGIFMGTLNGEPQKSSMDTIGILFPLNGVQDPGIDGDIDGIGVQHIDADIHTGKNGGKDGDIDIDTGAQISAWIEKVDPA